MLNERKEHLKNRKNKMKENKSINEQMNLMFKCPLLILFLNVCNWRYNSKTYFIDNQSSM